MESLFTKKEQVGNKIKGLLKSPVFWTAVIAIATVFSTFIAYKIYNLSFSKQGEPPQPSITTSKTLENEYEKKINEANKYYKEGKFDEVIRILEPLIERNKKSGEISQLLINSYFGKGDSLMNSGRIEEGIQFFLEAYYNFPEKRTKYNLQIRLRKAIKKFEEDNQYEKAVAHSRKLVEEVCRSRENINEHIRLLTTWGERFLYLTKNYYKAAELFEEAHSLDRENQTVKEYLAKTLETIGDIQSKEKSLSAKNSAIQNYQRSYNLKPKGLIAQKISGVYLAKYEIFSKLENYSKMEECLKEIIRFSDDVLPPLDPATRKLMDQAEASLSSHRYKEAGVFFREAWEKNPWVYLFYYKETAKTLIRHLGGKDLWVPEKVSLNKANLAEMRLRLGISIEKSIQIIESRPYSKVNELLSKGVFQQDEYNKIRDKVAVR